MVEFIEVENRTVVATVGGRQRWGSVVQWLLCVSFLSLNNFSCKSAISLPTAVGTAPTACFLAKEFEQG